MDTVLFFGGSHTPFAELGITRRMGEGEIHLTVNADSLARREIALLTERDVGRALRRLSARQVDVVVIDARRGAEAAEAAASLLERLFPPHDVSGPARRMRTLVVVDGSPMGARVAFLAGTRRVADVLAAPEERALLDRVLEMTGKAHGKVALCLAGGGVEGLLYEVGVLRALDHFLDERRICDLDLYYGISAGSILGAFLANGLTPAEIADGLRKGTEKLDRITRRDVFDPNVGEVFGRALGFLRELVGMGEARNPLSALYRAIPSSAFRGDALREYLRRQLSRPGMTDHFEELRRPLYVGATDQDTSEAVVFGDTGWTDVPVHKAVRASCALAPFYAPERVGGRWYIDGAFTRTTNMRVAVKHGATMALIVDPLVPVYSEVAGYVRKKGGLFGTMQGLKALINGRFDKAVNTIREMYPEVAFHIVQPEADEMRILSGSPMKFLYREEIEELAYQRTLRKIRASLPQMSRDFARHDVVFREPPLKARGENPFEDGLAAA